MLALPPLPRFVPHPAVPGGDLQTIAGAVAPTRAPTLACQEGFARVSIPMRCGARLEGWFRPGPVAPAVLLMHGLGGSVASGYVRQCAARTASAGHPVLAIAHRGSGETGGDAERTTRPYMTGNTADVEDVMAWLRRNAKTERLFAVGFSISGNSLLLTLGRRTAPPPELSLAVCPPIDLDVASRDLLRLRARPYDLWVLRSCRRWIPRLRGSVTAPLSVSPFSGLRSFDERYITPVWGFRDLADYYANASAAPRLVDIESPTVILHADDDPIVRPHTVQDTPRSPWVSLEITRGGGHLGFLGRTPGQRRPTRWLPGAIAHYAAACRDGYAHSPERSTSHGARPHSLSASTAGAHSSRGPHRQDHSHA